MANNSQSSSSNPQDQQNNDQQQANQNVQQEAQPNSAVNRIQVRVPPFWKQNPRLWFRQLEAQFANSNITLDLTKFNTIVGVIESDILTTVSDVVLNPPENDLYETIKARLIHRFEETEQKKLKNLLNELTLGDMRPSDLLRKMKELSCNKVGDDLLKTLWLQRLPLTIQTVLSTSSETLDQLTVLADKMFEVNDNATVQAVSTEKPDKFNDLVNVVCKLDDKIESLRKEFRMSKKSSKQKSLNQPSTSNTEPTVTKRKICSYHKRFGENAIKCRKPCNFIPPKSKN